MGNAQAITFLNRLVSHVETPVLERRNEHSADSTRSEECEAARGFLSSQIVGTKHSFVLNTFDWVLHTREFSPLVYLHYTIANETLNIFIDSTNPSSELGSSFEDLKVFAVKVHASGTRATLLLQASQIAKCETCTSIESPNLSGSLSTSIPLSGEVFMSEKCNYELKPKIVIYADLDSKEFASWLREVEDVVGHCEYHFLLRFWLPSRMNPESDDLRPSLQGFTVQAALKNTEYKVIDDRVFSTKLFQDCRYGETACDSPAPEFENDEYEWSEANSNASEEYTGLQAFRFLTRSDKGDLDDALKRLQAFTEDTPSVLSSNRFTDQESYDKTEEKRVLAAVRRFREQFGENDCLFINDRSFDVGSLTQGTEELLRCLSVTSVAEMKLRMLSEENGEHRIPIQTSGPSSDSSNRLRVNLDVQNSLKSSLVWVNDLLKDSRYRKWKPLNVRSEDDVMGFKTEVKRTRSDKGSDEDHLQLVKVKAHHLSLTILLDPGDPQQFPYTGIPQSVVHADLPIHVGMALIPNGQVSSLITATFHYFLRMKGRKTGFRFLQMIQQILQYMGGGYQQVELSEQVVELAFKQIAPEIEGGYGSAREILDGDKEIGGILDEARTFAEENGLLANASRAKDSSKENDSKLFSMLGIFNGIVLKDISADVIRIAIVEQERISALLGSSSLESDLVDSKIGGWVEADSSLIVVESLSEEMKAGDERVSQIKTKGELTRISGTVLFSVRHELEELRYEQSVSSGNVKREPMITVWLVASDQSSTEFKSASSLMNQLAKSKFAERTRSRFALINPELLLHRKALEASSNGDGLADIVFVINGRILPFSKAPSLGELKTEVASEYKDMPPAQRSADTELIRSVLMKDVAQACTSQQSSAAGTGHVDFGDFANAVSSSNLSEYMFSSEGDQKRQADTALRISAVVNPIGQRPYILSSLLMAMREVYGRKDMFMTLAIVPLEKQMQMKHHVSSTYSKFVLGIPQTSDAVGGIANRLTALFRRLPIARVLTFAVIPPRPWFVSSYSTNYDMDNVLLATSGAKRLHAEYEIKSLIVEGSCIDEDDKPPQGLKLILENGNGISVDTLVMANLGYFQLKVPTPGRWFLRLAPGPSAEIFSLRIMEMYTGMVKSIYTVDSEGRVPILVASLSGAGGILLRVERKPGMENMSVLDPNRIKGDTKSLTERLKTSISSMYKVTAPKSSPVRILERDGGYIHVFSVASGHLYERFLKIMMSSVTRHASRPVKFWLLENYLSPSFKKMLPLFAKQLGCEVGMVTYKWPGWLRAQTEKQRIIWAYKILFLDVLFPLDVSRVIFVDSDQVARGDLAELMDIDLEGAPYGYVPFCDSRKEVEGYRFWKQGFWKETLRGAKYRISALYVVDLARFRETAAGDTLRYIYQSLSADPNSLSNLDQDLPNYASAGSLGAGASVPIFDLPAEWLWCESWCDDESKKTAKTIDLCNNPMTKEPKLESAKRIISEWEEYDDAASRMTEEIYERLAGATVDLTIQTSRVGTCDTKGPCTPPEDTAKDEL